MFYGAELKALRESVEGLRRIVDVQNEIIRGLRQDNRDLLNRLMVKNMREYAMTSPASVAEIDLPSAEVLAKSDSFSKEYLAGEVVSDET